MDTISGSEAAQMLGVSYSHLYTLIRRGVLRRVQEDAADLRAHNPLLFYREEVQALAERTKKKSSAA